MRILMSGFSPLLAMYSLIAMPGLSRGGEWIDGLFHPHQPHTEAVASWSLYDGVDIVGGSDNGNVGSGLAKGGSYQIDTSVLLEEMEFYIGFSDTQILTCYVFECPTEFGTYTEVYRNSETVTGTGTHWYSSGPIAVTLYEGTHYIIIISWSGTVGYYWNTGDSQSTSFGAYTHGYATGTHPLPSSFGSTSNDQAIYHQRITTNPVSSLDRNTWAHIKTLY